MIKDLTIKEELFAFYKKYNLQQDGGLNDSFVKIDLLKGISFYLPNIDDRKKVILKHDIHHIVTGYNALMKGESEISTWELSSGCFNTWVGVVLNLLGMMSGVLFNLRGIWKAWLRGKATKNLYYSKYSDIELLNKKSNELKAELGLLSEGDSYNVKLLDILSLLGMIFLGSLMSVLFILCIPFVVMFSLKINFKNLWAKH